MDLVYIIYEMLNIKRSLYAGVSDVTIQTTLYQNFKCPIIIL